MWLKAGTNWVCPHCDRPQTLTSSQVSVVKEHFRAAVSKHGTCWVGAQAVSCANPDCCEVTVDVKLNFGESESFHHFTYKGTLSQHRLRPRSHARHWPDHIPRPLREDYEEACLIATLSPKAAATLCRRCLQGMIRDFCGISKPTLDLEIRALRKLVDESQAPKGVDPETLDAIDAVRSIGNIGAHMEKDVDVIVPVDPDEASLLIGLIELLFEEWYVARHAREQKLAKLQALALEKKTLRANLLQQSATVSPTHDDETDA